MQLQDFALQGIARFLLHGRRRGERLGVKLWHLASCSVRQEEKYSCP
jgi:hypothetical protein